MSLKSLIQIIIVIVIFIILGGVYFQYFSKDALIMDDSKNNQKQEIDNDLKTETMDQKIQPNENILVDKKTNKNEFNDLKIVNNSEKNENTQKIQKTEETKDQSFSNLVKEVEYITTDKNGNRYHKGYILKTQANPGYLEVIELDKLNEDKIRELFNNCSICINLIGILYEKNKNQFRKIHSILPNILSNLAKEKKIEQFIHVSALGIENASDSEYAKSKLDGENNVRKNFKNSVILKPSIVYGVDDNFTTNFMTLLNRLPIMPLYYRMW